MLKLHPKVLHVDNDQLAKNCGKVIGLIRFGGSLSSEEARRVDPIFTDKPSKTEYHWLNTGRIPLQKPFAYSANVRWTRVSDPDLRKVLAEELTKRGETQPKIPIPKPTKKMIWKCPFCAETRSKKSTMISHCTRSHPKEYIPGVTQFESSPAPSGYKYPCCSVQDDTALSICCDTCESWWHEICLQLTFHYTHHYLETLKTTSGTFTCPKCVEKSTGMRTWFWR